MLFSIIINTHNQYDQIDRCIKSCLNQDYRDEYEVIISDTSDKKIIKKYSKENVKIKIIESDSFSNFPCVDQMLSIKNVLSYATGRVICLLDGDDFFSPTKLNFLKNNFSQNDMFLNQDNLVGFNEQTQKKFIINKKKNIKII
jgi:glycosyltransferase involved in cell wall biosynthesis